MQLIVRGLDGQHSCLRLAEGDNVGVLKVMIQDAHGVPAGEQLLTANGRLLADKQSLSACGLQHGSTVHVLLRLCGGKGGFGALLRGQGRDGKITDNFDAMRDLSGRRIRHVEAERKLQEWQQDAKERELEQIALKHMKEMAKQAKRERDYEVNVEEVKRQHKEAADAVAEAVHTALAQGLQQQAGPNSKAAASSSAAAAAVVVASSDSSDQEAATAGPAGSPAEKQGAGGDKGVGTGSQKKKSMLDMLDGVSDEDSSSDDAEEEA